MGVRLAGARVLVTGGGGFLGRALLERLHEAGAKVTAPARAEYDLLREAEVTRMFTQHRPEVVFHLAADVGGIGYNLANPGHTFYVNTMMGALVMEQARRAGVRKLVAVGSVCAYPERARVPFREDELWDGYPEPTNGAYGSAKRMLLVQGQAYRAQYGFSVVHLLMMNLYGPGDHFDAERAHVIPALIGRFLDAAAPQQDVQQSQSRNRLTRWCLSIDEPEPALSTLPVAARRQECSEPLVVRQREIAAARERL